MRSPVYRSLDRPFQVYGFNAVELIVLCFSFVGGGEVSQLIFISRVWSFVMTIVLALTLYLVRRAFGGLFWSRFFRFLQLPNKTFPKLLILR